MKPWQPYMSINVCLCFSSALFTAVYTILPYKVISYTPLNHQISNQSTDIMIDSIENDIIAMNLWYTIPVIDLLCLTAKLTLNTIIEVAPKYNMYHNTIAFYGKVGPVATCCGLFYTS